MTKHCSKSLSEKLKERYSGNKKKTFKERAVAFGEKATKAYNAANKGLDKVEGFIYGKPKSKPARKPAKKSAAKSTAKRAAQAYPKVVYVPYPIYPSPLPKVKRQTKSSAKKKTTKRR